MRMLSPRSLVVSGAVGGVLLALAAASLAQAASVCKDKPHTSCERDSRCTWVKGYTTKSGNRVSAYCRKKSSSSRSSSSSSSSSSRGSSTSSHSSSSQSTTHR